MKRFLKYTSCLSAYCYNFTYVHAYIHNCMHSYCHITLQWSFVRGWLLSKLFGFTPCEWLALFMSGDTWRPMPQRVPCGFCTPIFNWSACCAQHFCASLWSSWQLITGLVAYISCYCWRSLSAGFAPVLKLFPTSLPDTSSIIHPGVSGPSDALVHHLPYGANKWYRSVSLH